MSSVVAGRRCGWVGADMSGYRCGRVPVWVGGCVKKVGGLLGCVVGNGDKTLFSCTIAVNGPTEAVHGTDIFRSEKLYAVKRNFTDR